MTIRIERKDRFAVIDKGIFDDKRLSYKATGLLCYLLSKPDNWQIHMSQLANSKTDGKLAVRAAIKELVTCGYITQQKTKDQETKRWRWIYIVREHPQIESQGIAGRAPQIAPPNNTDLPSTD